MGNLTKIFQKSQMPGGLPGGGGGMGSFGIDRYIRASSNELGNPAGLVTGTVVCS